MCSPNSRKSQATRFFLSVNIFCHFLSFYCLFLPFLSFYLPSFLTLLLIFWSACLFYDLTDTCLQAGKVNYMITGLFYIRPDCTQVSDSHIPACQQVPVSTCLQAGSLMICLWVSFIRDLPASRFYMRHEFRQVSKLTNNCLQSVYSLNLPACRVH